MSSKPGEDDTGRRKFDDVASLFGAIVPNAGTPVRAGPVIRAAPAPELKPQALGEPTRPAAPVSPRSLVDAPTIAPKRITPEPVTRTARIALPVGQPILDPPREPPPGSTSSRNLPWPDAFEPRPNWRRKPSQRSWSWVLLVPLGAIVAIAAATLDPRAIREFVDRTLQRAPPQQSVTAPSLLPEAFRSPPPSALAPPAEGAPAANTATAAEQNAGSDAGPRSSADRPPGAEPAPVAAQPPTPASAPPAPIAPPPSVPDPAPAPAATSDTAPPTAAAAPQPAPVSSPATGPSETTLALPLIAHATVFYRRANPAAEADARRLAVRLEPSVGAIDIRPVAQTTRAAVITYYNLGDKDSASALARTLAKDGTSWIVRAGPTRQATGTVDLFLP